MRIKTSWFRQRAQPRSPEETATVVAATIWRLADRAVTNLSKADYAIVTAERGMVIIAEFAAFLTHLADRFVYSRLDANHRVLFMQALGRRLAETARDNARALSSDDSRDDLQADFVALLNRRAAEYATFNVTGVMPELPMVYCLGNHVRDCLMTRDQPWIIDKIADAEAPQAVLILQKTIEGLYGRSAPPFNPAPAA